jgi:hypothetical protein
MFGMTVKNLVIHTTVNFLTSDGPKSTFKSAEYDWSPFHV